MGTPGWSPGRLSVKAVGRDPWGCFLGPLALGKRVQAEGRRLCCHIPVGRAVGSRCLPSAGLPASGWRHGAGGRGPVSSRPHLALLGPWAPQPLVITFHSRTHL